MKNLRNVRLQPNNAMAIRWEEKEETGRKLQERQCSFNEFACVEYI
jgi:hypothetical protein